MNEIAAGPSIAAAAIGAAAAGALAPIRVRPVDVGLLRLRRSLVPVECSPGLPPSPGRCGP
jgi:hypothetical protein